MGNAYALFRVSRERQREKGWGLEAQRLLVDEFAAKESFRIRDVFIEVVSGRKYNRKVFAEAAKICKREDATLLIASVDRLTRNVHFIIDLIESKVKFKIVTQPNAPNVILKLLAVIAEDGVNTIREKTKAGLQAAKLNGVELGRNGRVLAMVNRMNAENFALHMAPIIEKIKKKGVDTQQGIAKKLNRMRVPTFRGGESRWHRTTVRMLLIRIEQEKQRQDKQNL